MDHAASDEDDDSPDSVLSSTALDALKEFYADRDAQQKHFEDLKARAEENAPLTMDAFREDWNSSQFWYKDETATILAKQLLDNADGNTQIAVVSAPSVFVQLKNILTANALEQTPKIYLLEYDERFSVFPEFVYYDFEKPLSLPQHLKGSIDHIICDPPFLSEDCQTKAALTVRWLSKAWGSIQPESRPRTIVCTGERMETLVNKLYRPQGIATTSFEPMHAKGLSNEFRCYANFECSDWTLKESDS